MKQILTLISCVILTLATFAQQKKAATFTAVKYQSINPDPFKNMPVNYLGLDYYYVEQITKEERLWYEIVVIGNKLVLHFHAKGSLNINTTDYEYEGKITDATIKKLKTAYKKAQLVQRIKGVPVTNDDYTVKEILITKSNDSLIGGGWYYLDLFTNKDQIKRDINFDKERTTSLSGNTELLIAEMKKSFPGLSQLMKKARLNK